MLANRLSEDSKTSVLLLEAGADDRGEALISVPMKGLDVAFTNNPFNWAFFTEPQKHSMHAYPEQVLLLTTLIYMHAYIIMYLLVHYYGERLNNTELENVNLQEVYKVQVVCCIPHDF